MQRSERDFKGRPNLFSNLSRCRAIPKPAERGVSAEELLRAAGAALDDRLSKVLENYAVANGKVTRRA